MQPFLRWAGGKRWLAPKIINHIPPFKRYFEPFIGSGVLFFAIEPQNAVISDVNRDLINCYRRIKYDCSDVIKVLKRLEISKKNYYSIRDKMINERDDVKRAAYFIYINQTCWNGIYRVNRDGVFNVPVGTIHRNKQLYNEDHLYAASKLLQHTLIKCCDFEYSIKDVSKGDLIYFDPPYITTHIKNGFIKYNEKLFSQYDELRLAVTAYKLANSGANVIVSNANHPLIRQQYDGIFSKYEIERMSTVAADSTNRRLFNELVITNLELNFEI